MWNDDVFIALGSNLGNSIRTFNETILELSNFCKEIQKSSIYITKPYGFQNQNDFHNAAISLKTHLGPRELLMEMQKIEKKLGKKVLFDNGPRAIDLDLIFFKHDTLEEEDLSVPHPLVTERDFVLLPLCDLAPKFVHPIHKKTSIALLKELNFNYFTGTRIPWEECV